ncbi:TIGR03503 family protein [Shewanella inventionis]|uniref:TIGR03503 family protein n=1 Tax=Shewanella inventionis TaxID=1738770 RepID=A0ABQ1IQA5_9GAMM|nr:TIGR03503 family protein [Shewanella inventionis]MCL1157210.1 TIGR03503 family protein [Shewanella inventionis]UAL41932.1 TIGR03503 family protein [Shewanella inventionis]GGB49006.1 TIGR03503 family protein [Shewanella inventionis]
MIVSLSRHITLVVLLLLSPIMAWQSSALAAPVKASLAAELKNRFRIDYMVESLTLVIQRDYGSAPVVVVLPDGSKWYSTRHPQNVKWVDGISADMIQIENPMPGPWQLLGQVTEGSTIQKISKLDIEVQPLPQPLFQGERLKITARLLGDNLTMRMPGLEYMVEWTSRFTSQHIAGDDNFATGTIIVGAYKDNGEELDEAPDDGIFTGAQNLEQPTGHYTLTVTARNNVFEREYVMPFKLSKQPITAEMVPNNDPLKGIWQIQLTVDESQVLLAETHFEFELVGPAGLQVPISLQNMTSAEQILYLPKVTEYGSYRVKGSVVSTTVEGREIVLHLPEMFFNLIEPPKPGPTAEELAEQAAEQAAIEEQIAKDNAIFWIIVVNGVLFIVGIIGIVVWRKRQTLAKAMAAAEERLKQNPPKEQKAEPSQLESLDLDDIDLTMPDDKH